MSTPAPIPCLRDTPRITAHALPTAARHPRPWPRPPRLAPARRLPVKPQQLLSYRKGGVEGLGFMRCMGVRWRNYK